MKVIKGNDIDYLLGFTQAKNVSLAQGAVVEAVEKLSNKYRDNKLRLRVPVSTHNFFEEVQGLLPEHLTLQVVA
ncbi:MAG: hypothetical protein IBX57_00245 [Gammaproteobacteria bacterium]|nr:hypothetical protein [Gammaproteobacteria bacterium]